MNIKDEIIEENGEIYFSKKCCLLLILDAYIFPEIDEYKAYLNCKRKTEYMAWLLAIKKYCKTKSEALIEIRNIKSREKLQEYVDKINDFITIDNLLDILNY